MTDDADALLKAVLAAPDDDAPRLVYADWLDEHGDPDRAAFIRAQVELARPGADRGTRLQLLQTERTLLRANWAAWTAWVPRWAHPRAFKRGLLDSVRCEAGDFIAHADEIRRRTPLLTVQLDGREELAVPLFRSRALDGIRSLTLSVAMYARTWEHLAACPYLGQLRELVMNSKGPAPEMVEALTGSDALPALQTLRLPWCALGDEHTARLVGHPWAARLRGLDLSNNVIAADGGQAVVDSQHLDRLDLLSLRGNPVADTWAAERLRRRFGGRVRL